MWVGGDAFHGHPGTHWVSDKPGPAPVPTLRPGSAALLSFFSTRSIAQRKDVDRKHAAWGGGGDVT